MGALHAGHKTLLLKAREIAGNNGLVVASIFLNPTQFDNAGDLASYPKTPESDLQICEQAGVDIVFTPAPADMYLKNHSVSVDESSLSTRLCGASRPGHFAGVCTVVLKLFNIVSPTDAVFGKKDFQQLAIIRKMVSDLNVPVAIHGAETVREEDGLALSSRNVRLTPQDRANAPTIRKALLEARQSYQSGASLPEIIDQAKSAISSRPNTRLDYLEIVDKDTLEPLRENAGPDRGLLAVAVFFGDVRLIDNIEL